MSPTLLGDMLTVGPSQCFVHIRKQGEQRGRWGKVRLN